jgi:hypothetical protein
MTDKYTWKEIEEDVVTTFHSQIVLMDEMLQSVSKNYIDKNKLFLFRELCFGFLWFGRNNSKATISLIKENLVDQVHYISRNTFEMMVILYYIDNDNDKLKRDELAQRFFNYQSVLSRQVMKVITDYPESFTDLKTEGQDRVIEQGYKDFISKYKEKGEKLDLKSWSGKNLYAMIDCFNNKEQKIDLMKRYQMMIKVNNNYLHPTYQSLRQSILRFLMDETDYKLRVTQLHSVTTSIDLIMQKFMEHFSKDRIAFRNRLRDIDYQYNAIMNRARDAGLLDT